MNRLILCETIMKTTDDKLKTLLYNFARDLKKETASLKELIEIYHIKISHVFREKVVEKNLKQL
ncbi:hypothetical protein L9Z41_08505 [Leptospira noguchii]|uniref:hypothetical protein n=1 Tax=Leptospira noguchii TaxID=28182 RepID=UPI001F06E9DE|nr:hypothetical protein [Leptospira noguchii]MCH1915676.1 hypothetical protein [Leptospira noguchii]